LAYININLTKYKVGHASHKVTALHDGGSEATLMTSSTFRKIPEHEHLRINPAENTYVSSVTGQLTPVKGSVEIYLTFHGDNGTSITFPHEVFIHDDIEHDFILGRDFTGSEAKMLETPTYMFLTAEPESLDLDTFWEKAKHTYCDVPLIPHDNGQRLFKMMTTETILIPAYSRGLVTTTFEQNTFVPIPVQKGKPVSFEVTNVLLPQLETPSALYEYVDSNNVQFTLWNMSYDDIIIPKGSSVAQIAILDPTNMVNTLSVTSTKYKTIKAYRAALHTAEFIEEDSSLTEEEKLQGFHQYITSGHYPISMTKCVEDAPSLTDLKLIDDKPITDEEFYAQFKISHLSPKHQEQAKTIFQKHKKAFSRHDYDLGCSTDIEMDIELKPGERKPILQSYFPLPHSTRKPMKEILDQMVKYDIIRECDEPSLFVSNILVIGKKDKSQFRMLLDGRLLNQETIKYPTNQVTSPEVIAQFANAKFISNMDVSHAFFQIAITQKSQPYTCFFSPAHGKRYCFQRCPQGLKNSPLYLKLLMDKLFGDMSNYVIHYADDILIATDRDLSHHIEVVGEVLKRLEKGNIKIRPNKLHLATDSIDFLGIRWQIGKLHIPEARVMAFKNYPKPKTPKQTKSFVCAMSYYRRFLPRFADIARPLLELTTQHHKNFKWTQEHDIAFYKLIDLLVTHTTLNIPNPEKPFYVQTDASDFCGAGRVFQKDDEGNELLLACVSRTFTRTERKYGVFRKETLSLLYALKSMDFFLRFANKIILLVDAKSIIYLRMCRDSAGILLRFSLELSKYEAEIFHVPGKENEISDILSRNHILLKDIIDEEKSRNVLTEEQTEQILKRLTIPSGRHFSAEEVKWLLEADSLENPIPLKKKKQPSKAKLGLRQIKNIPKTVGDRKVKLPRTSLHRKEGVILPVMSGRIVREPNTISYTDFVHTTKMITSGDVTKKNLILAQKDDPQLGAILNLKKLPQKFTMIDNILYHKLETHYRLALPQSFLDPLIHSKHFSVMGLHFSKSRILRDIQTKFFVNIKLLKEKLQMLKENCILCQFNKTTPVQHKLTQSNLIYAPRVTWACDIIPSLPTSKKGHNAMFLAVDMFSGYIQLAPLSSRSAPEMIEAVLRTIIDPFGIPKYFRCDSETAMFSSYEFHAFMEPLGIKFLPCSTGAPWSNGAAERAVQTIKLGVRKFVQQENAVQYWDEYIHFYSASHNKSTSVYGFAPEEIHFGFTNPAPNELFQLWPNSTTQEEYMALIVPKAEQARKKAREKQQQAVKDKITYRNIHLKSKTFKPGQIVLQRNLQLATGPGKAMQPKYNGPYVIISIDKDQSSALLEHMHSNTQVRAHFSNITLLNYLPSYHKAPGRYDTEMLQFIPEKFSHEKYYAKTKKKQKNSVSTSDEIVTPLDTPTVWGADRDSDSQTVSSSVENLTENLDLTQKVSLQKETIRLPSILKQIDPVQTLQNAINTSQKQKEDNTQKMQIIIPQILLKNPSKKLELIIPQLITKANESTENGQRRSNRVKKPPDKLNY
jgi:hypothetical protein